VSVSFVPWSLNDLMCWLFDSRPSKQQRTNPVPSSNPSTGLLYLPLIPYNDAVKQPLKDVTNAHLNNANNHSLSTAINPIAIDLKPSSHINRVESDVSSSKSYSVSVLRSLYDSSTANDDSDPLWLPSNAARRRKSSINHPPRPKADSQTVTPITPYIPQHVFTSIASVTPIKYQLDSTKRAEYAATIAANATYIDSLNYQMQPFTPIPSKTTKPKTSAAQKLPR